MTLKDDGFLIIKGGVNKTFLEQLRLDYLAASVYHQNVKSNDDHFLMIKDPYYTIPLTLLLAQTKDYIDIAEEYLGCKVGLGTCNLRRSKLTQAPPTSTNLFHCDENCGKGINIVKAFFYLNDVTEEGHGPFEYIKGSHINKMPGWNTKLRFSDDEVYNYYGIENSVKLFAEFGDVIMADTTGFHRGLQVKTQNRDMLTINYVPFMEVHGQCVVRSDAQGEALQFALRK